MMWQRLSAVCERGNNMARHSVQKQRVILQKRAQIIAAEESSRKAKIKAAALKAELRQLRTTRG